MGASFRLGARQDQELAGMARSYVDVRRERFA